MDPSIGQGIVQRNRKRMGVVSYPGFVLWISGDVNNPLIWCVGLQSFCMIRIAERPRAALGCVLWIVSSWCWPVLQVGVCCLLILVKGLFGEILIYMHCLDCITTAVTSYFSKYFFFGYNIQNSNLSGSLGLVWIWVLALSECKVTKQNVLA